MTVENLRKCTRMEITDKPMAKEEAASAAENGYEFTEEELAEGNAAQPISEKDAESVAGGTPFKHPLMPPRD